MFLVCQDPTLLIPSLRDWPASRGRRPRTWPRRVAPCPALGHGAWRHAPHLATIDSRNRNLSNSRPYALPTLHTKPSTPLAPCSLRRTCSPRGGIREKTMTASGREGTVRNALVTEAESTRDAHLRPTGLLIGADTFGVNIL